MQMKPKNMFAIALMGVGVWCLTHSYHLYNAVNAKAGRFLSDVFSAGIPKGDASAFAYALGGIALIVGAFFMFGEKKSRKKR